MSPSSHSILKGIHKIYQRILAKIPHATLKSISIQTLRADLNIDSHFLNAKIEIRGIIYSVTIATIIDEESYRWIPHSSVTDSIELIAITEMLKQYYKSEFYLSTSPDNRKTLFLQSCTSFFRANYR